MLRKYVVQSLDTTPYNSRQVLFEQLTFDRTMNTGNIMILVEDIARAILSDYSGECKTQQAINDVDDSLLHLIITLRQTKLTSS